MLKLQSVVEQVVDYLREELNRGRWTGYMPGRALLAKELGVHSSTIKRALVQLEQEGILKSHGAGKRRQILPQGNAIPSSRVLIVFYEPEDELDSILIELRYGLHAAGHQVSHAPKTLKQLKHHPKRVLAMMQEHPSEAYIVVAGARTLLEELSKSSLPIFALYGRMTDLPIAGAGPNKLAAQRQCLHRLFDSGRDRIVMLMRQERKQSGLGALERLLFEEFEKRNLPYGSYNLPDWVNTPEGLEKCLHELFKLTPPDAILVDDWMLYVGIQHYLSRQRGLPARQTICISMDYNHSFKWCRPGLAYFHWDTKRVIRYAVKWVNDVAKGNEDRNQELFEAEFVEGDALNLPSVR